MSSQGSTLTSQLLQGFRRGFQCGGTQGSGRPQKTQDRWLTLLSSQFMTTPRNTHGFTFPQWAWGMVGVENKQEIKCTEGEASLPVHGIFTSTRTSSHTGPGEVSLWGHLKWILWSYKSSMPKCVGPMVTTLKIRVFENKILEENVQKCCCFSWVYIWIFISSKFYVML